MPGSLGILDGHISSSVTGRWLNGILGEAEQVHLKGLELKPESPERWETYACFPDDLGRQPEAEAAYKKARMFTGNLAPPNLSG